MKGPDQVKDGSESYGQTLVQIEVEKTFCKNLKSAWIIPRR